MLNAKGNMKDMERPEDQKTRKRIMTFSEIMGFLKMVPLLEHVPEKALAVLASDMTIKHFRKGDIVFRNEDPALVVYFVIDGYVSEFVSYDDSVETIVKTRRKYEYIGEMGILSNRVYQNTAVAMENLTLGCLTKECFMNLITTQPSTSQFIIRELIDRLTNSARKFVHSMYLDAPSRLALTLLTLSSDLEGRHRAISLTQSEIANSCGIARQTVAKIIGEWRKNGWIRTERGAIEIIQMDLILQIISNSEMR